MQSMRLAVFAAVCAILAITVVAVYETKAPADHPMLLDLREDEYLFAGAPDCAGNKVTDITATTGDFKSQPEAKYQNNLKLCWKIQPPTVPQGSRVKLWFSKVELEKGYDFVRVYDLAENNKILDDEADTQTTYFSTKGFTINMITDSSTTAAGFVLRFAVESPEPSKPTTDEVVVNAFLDANTKLCSTQKYRNGGQLITRRGCTFKIGVSNKLVPTLFQFKLDETTVKYSFTVPVGGSSNGISCTKIADGFQFNIASSFPIGKYIFSVIVGTTEAKGSAIPIYIVFNPYSDKDPTYISDAAQRTEYIENEEGAVFTGSSDSHGARPWNYDHFSMNVLRTTMQLIAPLTVEQRQNPYMIARRLSHQGNDVLLWGKWSEPYSDGKKPWEWTGSAEIFQQFVDKKQQVKYGQCWVFAGTLTSMARSIGIGTRPVTNFDSAHEHKPFDQFCDEYYSEDASGSYMRDSGQSSDSIWNFHVWVEGWFTRPDLNQPAGWNAYDSTAQEKSDGLYQCGPAYIPFLKTKDVKSKYDNDFIAGETRCAVRRYLKKKGASKYEPLHIDYCHVGAITATKAVGSFREVNVAPNYKTNPSPCKQAFSSFLEVPPSSQVGFKVLKPKAATVGEPISLSVEVTGGNVPSTVVLNVVAYMTQSNGDFLREPSKDPKTLGKALPAVARILKIEKLLPNEKRVVPFTIDPKSYVPFLGSTVHMQLSYTGTVGRQSWLDSAKYSLQTPKLTITAPQNFVAGQTAKAQIVFKNPLNVPLKNGVLTTTVTGSLYSNQFTLKVPSIAPRATVPLVSIIKASFPGKTSIQSTLVTAGLIDISGRTNLDVQAPPKSRLHREKRTGQDGRFKLGPDKKAVGRKVVQAVTKLIAGKNNKRTPTSVPPPPIKKTGQSPKTNQKKKNKVGSLNPVGKPKNKKSPSPKLNKKLKNLGVKPKPWMKSFN